MKITIDTERDSKEEIKKAIKFLQQLTEEATPETNPEGMFGMFSEDTTVGDLKEDSEEESAEEVPKFTIEPY